MNNYLTAAFGLVLALSVAGCGGGAGGSASGGGSVLPPAPSQTPAATTFTVQGTVNTTSAACDGVAVNCASTGAANGFSVVLGGIPGSGSGSPTAPLFNATTDSSGHFSLSSVPAGTYEIQIGKDSTFASIHAKVNVSANASLTYTVSALGSGEQSWFTSINSYRSQNGVGAIGADEYAMEADRAYAEYLEASPTNCTSNGQLVACPQYAQQYQSAGGMFNYNDTYRVALLESDCPSFSEQTPSQAAMLKAPAARFGGYGFRGSGGALNAGSCVFAMVSN